MADFPLLTDAKAIIVKYLKTFGLEPIGLSTQDVLHSYFNFKHKFIKNRSRKVVMSDGIHAQAKKFGVEQVLSNIERKCNAGEDINPFLSKGIFRLGEHDHLLNDWKIHHLHLNNNKVKPLDYFNERSDLLLFIHVTNEEVYFIEIRHHNENYVFAQRDLLRTIRNNWPQLNAQFLLREEESETFPKFDEQGIVTMRRKGYTFFTQVDNYVYAPGLGSAISGFSLEASMEMNKFHRQLYKIHCYILEKDMELKNELSKLCARDLKTLQFTLVFKDWLFDVYEMNSRRLVRFDLDHYEPPYPAEQSNPIN